MSTATPLKGWLTLRTLVHDCHGGKRGGTTADMLPEKEPRVLLHLEGQAAGRESDTLGLA